MPRRTIIAILATTLIGLLAGCGSDEKSDSDGGVNGGISAGRFADPDLEACVRSALNVPEGDLSAGHLAEIVHLECQDMGIADIAGIERCTNMESLSLWENEIVDISPLSNLTALTSLQLGNNLITDLSPLSDLTGLTTLGLSFNRIVDVSPLAPLSFLLWLNLDANRIVDGSPLAGLTGLEWLTVERNRISDFSPLEGLAAGDCIVYMDYQGCPSADMERSLSTKKIHEEGRIRAKSVVVDEREEGRLVPVLGADNEIELQYDLGQERHRIIPEFSGKLVLHNNLIVLEGRSTGPVTVGEMTSTGHSICSGDYAATCSLNIGMKTGSRVPLKDDLPGRSAPAFTAALSLRNPSRSALLAASSYDIDTAFETANEEMLPFVLASPNQYDAGSCLFMATTGAAEILMNQRTSLDDIRYLGETDLSERYLMNANDYVPSFAEPWFLSDLIYAYNYLGGSMLDRNYPMAADTDGTYIRVGYSWTNDLPGDWEDQLVETPGFERTIIFIDPAKDANSKWNLALMDGTTVEQIKYELRTKNAPVIIVYNHYLYWHSDIIVGYDDSVETEGCPMVTSSLSHFAQEGFHEYVTKIEDHMDELGGCTDRGVFYVRDSIYEGEDGEPTYSYGGPYPFTEKYSKRIIERTYNWVKFLANHAYTIHRAETDPDNDMDGYTLWEDCNDCDENIHPGVSEVPGNGIDDNCNNQVDEWTIPTSAIVSVHGPDSLTSSNVMNGLALLLIPVGAVVLLRMFRVSR